MSKRKKFKQGLDSLFEHIAFEEEQSSHPLLRSDKTPEKKPPPEAHHKRKEFEEAEDSFANSLDDLFRQDLSDAVLDKVEKARTSARQSNRKRKGVRGLDLLIRETLRNERVEMEVPKAQARVTFVFDKEKLDRLKDIARMEKKYLKDIIDNVVQEFIEEYENEG